MHPERQPTGRAEAYSNRCRYFGGVGAVKVGLDDDLLARVGAGEVEGAIGVELEGVVFWEDEGDLGAGTGYVEAADGG